MEVHASRTTVLLSKQSEDDATHQQEIRADIAMNSSQLHELVDSVRHLSNAYDDKKGEKFGKGKAKQMQQQSQREKSTRQLSTAPQPLSVVPISRSQPQPQHESSSKVTHTGSRMSLGNPAYVNKNLQGIHVVGEKRINMPNLGPRDSREEMIKTAAEDKERSERRRETKKYWLSKERKRRE